jgi:hypothetical protein
VTTVSGLRREFLREIEAAALAKDRRGHHRTRPGQSHEDGATLVCLIGIAVNQSSDDEQPYGNPLFKVAVRSRRKRIAKGSKREGWVARRRRALRGKELHQRLR